MFRGKMNSVAFCFVCNEKGKRETVCIPHLLVQTQNGKGKRCLFFLFLVDLGMILKGKDDIYMDPWPNFIESITLNCVLTACSFMLTEVAKKFCANPVSRESLVMGCMYAYKPKFLANP